MKHSEIVRELVRVGADDAESEASVILEELFGASRSDILLNRDKDYDDSKIKPIIDRFIKKWDIHYDDKYTYDDIKRLIINDKKNEDNKVVMVYLEDIKKYDIRYVDDLEIKNIIERCGNFELK